MAMQRKLPELSGSYEPNSFEPGWADEWAESKNARVDPNPTGKSFSMVIPPPNVTGVLHMGHALNNTLQDILLRYHRMCGDNAVWIPGTDHAGIATQNIVERQLAAEGLTKEEMGRDAFLERVWQWKEESGGKIIGQLKRLGASCDWSRERFTMDEGLSLAVRRVFVRLYSEGLIYRGTRLINWCPRCHTALSDIEVEHHDEQGRLYHMRYPFADGSGALVVATTRPETLLGDVAVAVHPEDERYHSLIGKQVVLPLTGRTIPIIADTYVDAGFGSGVVKITPAHDFNDYEVGARHNLTPLSILNESGEISIADGAAVVDSATREQFEGLDRMEARKQIIAALETADLMERVDEHFHAVGHCYRCQTVVEPFLSPQWFVQVGPPDQPDSLAGRAIRAVAQGDTKVIPDQWKNSYFAWMENIKDWCISRQLWWGHRIPAYSCQDCGRTPGWDDAQKGDPDRTLVSETPLEKCPYCRGTVIADPDVLDTWFSSSLWPLSTLGWPEETPDLKKWYPTATLITGFDILFFWVARMMMMGLHLRGEVPFRDVYIHALVRDAEGQKMSKSKGNVIDPLTIIDQYGADPLRFTLAAMAAQGRDIKLSFERIEGYRAFANKIWNATKFALLHLENENNAPATGEASTPDQWIISRLDRTREDVRNALDDYRFNDAANRLYAFIWHELCDWYLELSKPVLFGDDATAKAHTRATLRTVFNDSFALLHPFMPFLTEELWHHIPGNADKGMLSREAYPEPTPTDRNEGVERDMDLVINLIKAVRNIKGENGVAPGTRVDVRLHIRGAEARDIIVRNQRLFEELARISELDLEAPDTVPKAAKAVVTDVAVFIPLAGLIDIDEEIKRLEKESAKIDKEAEKLERKLGNEEFLGKAPEAVVTKERNRLAELKEKKVSIESGLESLRA